MNHRCRAKIFFHRPARVADDLRTRVLTCSLLGRQILHAAHRLQEAVLPEGHERSPLLLLPRLLLLLLPLRRGQSGMRGQHNHLFKLTVLPRGTQTNKQTGSEALIPQVKLSRSPSDFTSGRGSGWAQVGDRCRRCRCCLSVAQ